jgi:hypothetical protein
VILDCYRLAKVYGIDPDVFLSKPMSSIARHRMWTARLVQEMKAASEDGN